MWNYLVITSWNILVPHDNKIWGLRLHFWKGNKHLTEIYFGLRMGNRELKIYYFLTPLFMFSHCPLPTPTPPPDSISLSTSSDSPSVPLASPHFSDGFSNQLPALPCPTPYTLEDTEKKPSVSVKTKFTRARPEVARFRKSSINQIEILRRSKI